MSLFLRQMFVMPVSVRVCVGGGGGGCSFALFSAVEHVEHGRAL